MEQKNGQQTDFLNLSESLLVNSMQTLLKSEIFKCINSYLECSPENILCDLCTDGNGDYVFRCKIKAKRLKMLGFLPGDVL